MRAHSHFVQRVHERMKGEVDPQEVWDFLCAEINGQHTDKVRFIVRVSRDGRRVWRFSWNDAVYFGLFDHNKGIPITVLVKELKLSAYGKGSINLESMT